MELILVNLKPQAQPRWMGGYGKGRGEKTKKNKKNDKDLVKLHSQQFCLVLNRIVQGMWLYGDGVIPSDQT